MNIEKAKKIQELMNNLDHAINRQEGIRLIIIHERERHDMDDKIVIEFLTCEQFKNYGNPGMFSKDELRERLRRAIEEWQHKEINDIKGWMSSEVDICRKAVEQMKD